MKVKNDQEFKDKVKVKMGQVTFKDNIMDLIVYTIIVGILLIPFFQGEYLKHISLSLIIGFLFGMLNRIIREICLFKEYVYKTKNDKNEI